MSEQNPLSSILDSTPLVGVALLAVAGLVWLSPSVALAQSGAESEVERLVDEATDAYDTLKIEKAQNKLKQAIETGQQEDVSPELMARAYVVLGVVQYGATKSEDDAKKAFIAALKKDSDATVPDVYKTPTLSKLMEKAREEAGPFDQKESDEPDRKPGRSVDEFTHETIATADAGKPMTVEAFVPRDVTVDSVVVAFSRYEENEWSEVELDKKNATKFATEIAGNRIYTSQIAYYIEAVDSAGDVVANSGSKSDPHSITVLGSSDYQPEGGETTEEGSSSSSEQTGTGSGQSGGGQPKTGGGGQDNGFVGLGFGTGVGFLPPERSPTANPNRDIEPGLAPAISHALLSGGGVLNSQMELGLYFRWQFTPAQDFAKIRDRIPEGNYSGFQNGECLGTGIPGDCLLGLKFRYFFTKGQPLHLYSTVGAGFGRVRHWLRLKQRATTSFCADEPVHQVEGAPNYCYRNDTVRPGWMHIGAGGGLGYPLSNTVVLLGEAYLQVFFPDAAVNLDFTFGPQFRF